MGMRCHLLTRKELCDERSRFKIERDHYYAKMEKLSQTGPGSDADLLRRGLDVASIHGRTRRRRTARRRSFR